MYMSSCLFARELIHTLAFQYEIPKICHFCLQLGRRRDLASPAAIVLAAWRLTRNTAIASRSRICIKRSAFLLHVKYTLSYRIVAYKRQDHRDTTHGSFRASLELISYYNSMWNSVSTKVQLSQKGRASLL